MSMLVCGCRLTKCDETRFHFGRLKSYLSINDQVMQKWAFDNKSKITFIYSRQIDDEL